MQFYHLWNRVNEAAEHYIPALFEALRKNPDPNLWVHFTEGVSTASYYEAAQMRPKLGVRPRITHSDPIGIYAFPKSYVLTGELDRNPHFFNMRFAYILKLRPGLRILNLHKITSSQIQAILKKLGIKSLADDAESFWEELRTIGQNLGYSFFQPLGIDAIYDEEGIIHYNEKHQICILDPKGYTIVDVLDLKQRQDRNKTIAIKLLHAVAKNFFGDGNYSIRSSKYYSERTINAYGIYQGQKAQIWVKYGYGETVFSATVNLSYALGKSRSYGEYDEKIYLNYDEKLDIEERGREIGERYKKLFAQEEFHEPKTEELRNLAAQIAQMFGLTKSPYKTPNHETFSIDRHYKLGKLNINIYHSYYDGGYRIAINLKVPDVSSSQGAIQISGTSERQDANDAQGMVKEALAKAEEAIYQHYNPDPDKHSGWDKYSWADRGRKLIAFLEFIKNRVYKEKA